MRSCSLNHIHSITSALLLGGFDCVYAAYQTPVAVALFPHGTYTFSPSVWQLMTVSMFQELVSDGQRDQ